MMESQWSSSLPPAMRNPSPWQAELCDDLISLVLQRLPSHAERVRFRAVCRSWRAAAVGVPPPMPWLTLRDGSLIDFDGNPVRCPRPILRDGVVSFHPVGGGGGDNLVFLEHDDGGCSLMNPLSVASAQSGDRENPLLPLPKLAAAVRRAVDSCETRTLAAYTPKPSYRTVIMSSPVVDSSSPDTLVAALILNRCAVAISTCKQHGDDDDDDAVSAASFSFMDERSRIRSFSLMATTICGIAFLHGKLYAVTSKECLHVLDLNGGGFRRCIADDPEKDSIYTDVDRRGHLVVRYLVESGSRLLMVRWWKSLPPPVWNADRPPSRFEVLEADDLAAGGRWKAVDGLRGRALFLGKADSRSVLAAVSSQHGGGGGGGGGAGAREDCIYFMRRSFWYPSKEEDFGQSGVYDMRSGEISPLQLPKKRGTAELRLHCEYPRWFFPTGY